MCRARRKYSTHQSRKQLQTLIARMRGRSSNHGRQKPDRLTRASTFRAIVFTLVEGTQLKHSLFKTESNFLCPTLEDPQSLTTWSMDLSLIHISEPTRLLSISYAVF